MQSTAMPHFAGCRKVRVRPAWSNGEHWVPGDVRTRSDVAFEEQPTLQQRVDASDERARKFGKLKRAQLGRPS